VRVVEEARLPPDERDPGPDDRRGEKERNAIVASAVVAASQISGSRRSMARRLKGAAGGRHPASRGRNTGVSVAQPTNTIPKRRKSRASSARMVRS